MRPHECSDTPEGALGGTAFAYLTVVALAVIGIGTATQSVGPAGIEPATKGL